MYLALTHGQPNGVARFSSAMVQRTAKGVMILINPKLDCKVEKYTLDNNGRFIILDVALEDAHIILVNIYAPNEMNQQVKFFKLVQHHLQDFSKEIVIIGGDFNCSLSDKDQKDGNPITKKASGCN